MNKPTIKLLALLLLLSTTALAQKKGETKTDEADLQAGALKQTLRENSSSNTHPDAQWFPKAGLGLFIHWGMISQLGSGDLSWCMLANKPWKDKTITPNQYYACAQSWRPDKLNFNDILKKAKAAGVNYAVFVTKHHDGFTLWPSKYCDMGTQTTFNGRDFVKEFVEACRKNNIRVGLYYSPPDWWFDRKYKNFSFKHSEKLDMDHKPAVIPEKPADHDRKRVELVRNQVTELLTNYGKIDLIWFDGGFGEIPNREVRRLQPGIVINNRNGNDGDYGDTEGKLPTTRFSGWFETCETCWPSGKWSYTEEWGWDTAPDVISELVKLRSWGGNLLANLGPKSDGTIPQQALTAWKEMSVWMKKNRESVEDVSGGPWPEEVNFPVTQRKGVAYLHLLPRDYHTAVWKNSPKPRKAILLRTGKEIPFTYEDKTLKIELPQMQRSGNVDVVKLVLTE